MGRNCLNLIFFIVIGCWVVVRLFVRGLSAVLCMSKINDLGAVFDSFIQKERNADIKEVFLIPQ